MKGGSSGGKWEQFHTQLLAVLGGTEKGGGGNVFKTVTRGLRKLYSVDDFRSLKILDLGGREKGENKRKDERANQD